MQHSASRRQRNGIPKWIAICILVSNWKPVMSDCGSTVDHDDGSLEMTTWLSFFLIEKVCNKTNLHLAYFWRASNHLGIPKYDPKNINRILPPFHGKGIIFLPHFSRFDPDFGRRTASVTLGYPVLYYGILLERRQPRAPASNLSRFRSSWLPKHSQLILPKWQRRADLLVLIMRRAPLRLCWITSVILPVSSHQDEESKLGWELLVAVRLFDNSISECKPGCSHDQKSLTGSVSESCFGSLRGLLLGLF